MSAKLPNPIPDPIIDLSFPHHWQAEILAARPLILSPRHFVYPRAAEEAVSYTHLFVSQAHLGLGLSNSATGFLRR